MPAYVIVDVNVTDSQQYDEYRALSGASVEQYGGRFLARGGVAEVLEGDWKPGRIVVIEFADAEQAKTWYNSPEYTKARDIRQRASTGSFLLVQGIS